ncbi:DapH/DapD/GlmU-related protein [Psychrobacter sp. 1Y1]|uniref:CatB-related O-acetyltransferase n=1 Tax=Psychrobacter sp. 1Y1 TaxID=3453574 RepID=UPI003F47E378
MKLLVKIKEHISKYKKLKEIKNNKCFIDKNSKAYKNDFGGSNYIGRSSTVVDCNVGFATYIGAGNFLLNVKFGKFCSIGNNIKVVFSNHPINYVSTHPAFHRGKHPVMVKTELCFIDKGIPLFNRAGNSEYSCIIGNDVWIGDNVTIMDGLSIGDGAIIAANAVITKNIEPYSIVGGIPAKHIRYRFKPEEIEQLLKIKWWDKDLDKIKSISDQFDDIENFLNNNRSANSH